MGQQPQVLTRITSVRQGRRMRIKTLSVMLVLLILLVACSQQDAVSTPILPEKTAVVTLPPSAAQISVTTTPTPNEPGSGNLTDLTFKAAATIIAERTPLPSPTPGLVSKIADNIVVDTGFANKSFLGLSSEHWINLLVSVLLFVLFFFLGVRLLFLLLRWLIQRIKTDFLSRLIDSIEKEMRWLIVLLAARFSSLRLDFLSNDVRLFLQDIFFFLMLGVIYIISLRLTSFTADWYLTTNVPEGLRKQLKLFIVTLKRLAYLFITVLVVGAVLSHFGINVTLSASVILFVGVLAVVGAREVISDAVSGFIILMGQPFRVGDIILVKELETTGTVKTIGLRSTHIRTYDNREVIIPNSLISTSQIVNYTYPESSFRLQIDIGVAYGTDVERVIQLLTETVRGVEGVMTEKGKDVDAYFMGFGDSALDIHVQWWIAHVKNRYQTLSRVNTAIAKMMKREHIKIPYTTVTIEPPAVDDNTLVS